MKITTRRGTHHMRAAKQYTDLDTWLGLALCTVVGMAIWGLVATIILGFI